MPAELAYCYHVQPGLPTALNQYELQRLQLRRLNATIQTAREKSRFYRQHLPATQLSSLAELASLPLMDAGAFANGYEVLLSISPAEVKRLVTLPTSGTTSKAKRLAFSDADLQASRNYFAAGMRMLTSDGQVVAVLFPCDRSDGLGQLLVESIRQAGCQPLAFGLPSSIKQLACACQQNNVRALVGFPQHLLALARWCEHHSIDLDILAILPSADNIPAVLKSEVSRIWGAATYGHFGMTETGYGAAVQCPQQDGYHIRETELLFEIIDPVSCLPLPDGQWGELVFTTLNRQAMPLIRYRTGDRTRLLPGRCGCGSILRRIDTVYGRLQEDIQIGASPTDRLAMYQLEEVLFGLPGVLDFAACWHQSKRCLQLRVAALPASIDGETVQAGLATLPPLASAQATAGGNPVQLEVEIETPSDVKPYYPAKRRIISED
ncbi:MAG: hypothetical protein LBR39_00340 [Coriobacteriales bacterium]|jgi:phenylacetate-coenzyme A ligase PaaK-like adenylate-forming protein|nr:hypothetical protein [Coriobacteriales bacterium]